MNKQTGIKDKFDTTSLKKLFARYGLVFIVAIIIIIMCFAVEAFRQPTNLLNICKQISSIVSPWASIFVTDDKPETFFSSKSISSGAAPGST